MSVFTALNKLKTNIFGGPGNTGFTKPPASRVQDIGIQPSPTGLLDYDPLSLATFSYPLDVQNNFQNGHYMLFYVNVQNKSKYTYETQDGINVGNVKQYQFANADGNITTYDGQGDGLTARYAERRAIKSGKHVDSDTILEGGVIDKENPDFSEK